MLRKIGFILSFISVIPFMNAQEIIPFRITKHNNIIVKTLVNNRDSLDLMFQIAMEDASISPERKKSCKSIVFKDEISENNSVKIGDLELKNITFHDKEFTGHEADGKIGKGFFKGKTYAINYDENQFVVYEKLPDVKGYKEISFAEDQQGHIFLYAENKIGNEIFEANFLLQSGYSGGLLFNNQIADDKKLNEKLKIIGEKTLTNSYGQKLTTKQGVLPELKIIDDVILKNVGVGFFTGAIKNQSTNYFGADLMRRFNWIFDAETKIIYIKPSKYFNEPYYKMN